MFRSKWLSVLAGLALASAVTAQDVQYEQYKLPNGMNVILHEDHSLPMACVNIWYHVASKDEMPGRSGFAHLFEHLMFMGTNRVPGSDFDNIMEAGGGWNNATTSEDRTNYFEMGPAELLPTLLWLEADRLEALGEAMTQEKLDKQRAVVRNERRQSYENRPYGKSELQVYEMMFPEGHPYHIPVIGTHEDLEAATVDDVKIFFAKYYVPSNMSLVVAGDFDPGEIKPLIGRLFGSLPRESDVVHAEADPVKLSGVKTLTMTDNVQFAKTTMVYHSPKHFHDGDADMDLVAAILTDGISSRLYQKLLYENEFAVNVRAYQSSMMLGSLFYIEATARPGVELDQIEKVIDEVLEGFAKSGPTPEELERQKSKIEYRTVSQLQSILAKADRLNAYRFHFGEPNSFKRDLDRYRQATRESVKRWAQEVLTPDARLILRVIPELKAEGANDRDQRPEIGAARTFDPLLPTTLSLSNGMVVHHWQRKELPLVELAMLLPHGTTSDPKGQGGVAVLTADMLDEGTGELSAVAFADALDQLGARFTVSSALETTTANLSVLARNFEKALGLYAGAVRRPSFDENEWKRVHGLHIQRLTQSLDRPAYVARTVAMRLFHGDAHPYSRPTGGTTQSVGQVTLDDISTFHKRLYRPSSAVLLVAGDLPTEDVKRHLEKAFGDWADPPDAAALEAISFPPPANRGLQTIMVDRPDAVQTVVHFIMPGPSYADETRPQLELLNTILGGSFTSRLNQNLREEHGYTYGARSRFEMNPSAGYFTASSSVRADVTGASVSEFLGEFAALRGADVTADEAKKAQASRRMGMMQSFAGLRGIVDAGATLVRNGRPFSALAEELALIAQATEADLNRLATKAPLLERGLLVLVGDGKLIREQMIGIPIREPVERTVTGDAKLLNPDE